jgi:tRNA pseudouridine13 synthase
MPHIKQVPEDFVVREIFEKQPRREGWKSEDEAYVWFNLTKRNYDLFRCLKTLSRRLGVSPKRFGYAGTKDKRAVTTQKISVWNVPVERLKAVRLKDIELSNFEEAKERINLGDLKANEFEITVRNIEANEKERIERNLESIKKNGFINFFGEQRFGNRGNTHLVGREILRNNLKEAVWLYLAGEGGEGSAALLLVRERFARVELDRKVAGERVLFEARRAGVVRTDRAARGDRGRRRGGRAPCCRGKSEAAHGGAAGGGRSRGCQDRRVE